MDGAKFRLYSDAECKNEVYVKTGQDGYIVINRDSLGGTDHTGGTKPDTAVEMVSDANVHSIFMDLTVVLTISKKQTLRTDTVY